MKASVCIFSAAHGRVAVSELVFKQRERLIHDLAAGGREAVGLVYAEDDNLDVARAHGLEAVHHKNMPLGAKCDAGLRQAATMADYVVWVGSDDWIHPDIFDSLETHDGTVHTGDRLAMVDLAAGRLIRISSPGPYGVIPWIIDSRLLAGRHHLIPHHLRNGLDGGLVRGMRLNRRAPLRFVSYDPHDLRGVDFKTAENITPYKGVTKHLAAAPEEEAWPALLEHFPAALVADARALHKNFRDVGLHPSQPSSRNRLRAPDGSLVVATPAGAEVLRRRGYTDVE